MNICYRYFAIFFLLIPTFVFPQQSNRQYIKIETAKKLLDRAELLYSQKSEAYILALARLSVHYYNSPNTRSKAIGKELYINSLSLSKQIQQFEILLPKLKSLLPQRDYELIYAEFEKLQEQQSNPSPKEMARKNLKRAQLYRKHKAKKWYPLCILALTQYIEEDISWELEDDLTYFPPQTQALVQELQTAKEIKYTKGRTLAYARLLLSAAESHYNLQNELNIPQDSSYKLCTEALKILSDSLGTNSKSYQNGLLILPKDYRNFYTYSLKFKHALQDSSCLQSDFVPLVLQTASSWKKIKVHSIYPQKINRLEDIFFPALKKIERLRGQQHPNFKRLSKHVDEWDLSHLQIKAKHLKGARDKAPHRSLNYLKKSLEYNAFIWKHQLDEAKDLYQLYSNDISLLDELSPQDPTIRKYFFRKIPSLWIEVLQLEYKRQLMLSDQQIAPLLYAQTVYQILDNYRTLIRDTSLWKNIFIDEQVKLLQLYATTSDSTLLTNIEKEIEKYYKQFPAQGSIELETVLKNMPYPLATKLLKKDLRNIAQKEGSYNLSYAKRLKIIADIQLNNAKKSYANEAYKNYLFTLDLFQNTEGKSEHYKQILQEILNNSNSRKQWSYPMLSELYDLYLQTLKVRRETDYRILDQYIEYAYKHKQFYIVEKLVKESLKQTDNLEQLIHYHKLLAKIYQKSNRIQQAQQHVNEALTLVSKDKMLSMFKPLSKIKIDLQQAAILGLQNKFFEAENLLLQIEIEVKLKDNDPQKKLLIDVLRQQAKLYCKQDFLGLAEDCYIRILRIYQDTANLNIDNNLGLQKELANFYSISNQDQLAIKYFNGLSQKLKDPADRAEAHYLYAQFYQDRLLYTEAATEYKTMLQTDSLALIRGFERLSDEERLHFVQPIQKRHKAFLSFASQFPKVDSLQYLAFNSFLLHNGLGLELASNFQQIQAISQHQMLQLKYQSLSVLKDKIADMNDQNKKEELQLQSIQLENQLLQESLELQKALGLSPKIPTFNQLKNALGNEDALVQFVKIYQKEEQMDWYYAWLLKANSPYPKLIRLCTIEELQEIEIGQINTQGDNYITNKELSHLLYLLLWEPLERELTPYSTVHFSPDGELHKIAFETLLPSFYSSKYLGDTKNLRQYNNFRELLFLEQETVKEKSMLVMGGAKYTLSPDEIYDLAIQEEALQVLSNFYELPLQIQAGGENFPYLKGSEYEIKEISQIALEKQLQVTALSDAILDNKIPQSTPLEDNFKAYFQKNTAHIIHIASHAYFFEKHSIKTASQGLKDRIPQIDNPMMRSGLVFGNANLAWNQGKILDEFDDGLLSAYEIAKMNLQESQLVVLSACETARGDIHQSEGVMGLQRALKMAGAKKLILSLWKVPDGATALLMKYFYQAYLNGTEIHLALKKAKAQVRKKYSNPYYWAAFVLIE